MKIGLFGIGKMGFPIACNLAEDGHDVTVYDVYESARVKLEGTVLRWAETPRQVMEAAELAFFVGMECSQLKVMLDGADGVLAGTSGGKQTIIDLSTSDPADSVLMGEFLEQHGVHYLDCGMTGGVVGAKNRELVFMAGGKREVYDRYLPVLERLSKSQTYIGPYGCGHRMKLLHNAVSNSTFNVTIAPLCGVPRRCQILHREYQYMCPRSHGHSNLSSLLFSWLYHPFKFGLRAEFERTVGGERQRGAIYAKMPDRENLSRTFLLRIWYGFISPNSA